MKPLYWPWYWGPGYPVYGRDDRSNVGALQTTREQGGVNSYVHPVTTRAPFGGDAPRGIPLELVSDAVLGDVDTIELACLWSDELGTADAWYRLAERRRSRHAVGRHRRDGRLLPHDGDRHDARLRQRAGDR